MPTEIRFAFALNGGVSLAIWIGGVVDEVLRLVAAGGPARTDAASDTAPNPWLALCRELDVTAKVDVLAGSSAGGLNAAFLGTAVIHGCVDLRPIKQLWLDHGSFDRLLRRPTDDVLISVLNGDDNFLPHIQAAFRLLAENGTGYQDVDPPVTVHLTATSLAGRVTTISDGHGELASIDHRAEFVFRTPDFDFDHDAKAVDRLARACRSTASFPGAFEPSTVPVELYEPRHVTGGLFDGVTAGSISVIDGAVLVNLPAQSAIDAIIKQPSQERIERVLALVVPDPGDPDSGASSVDTAPTLNQVLSKSIVGIPRTQSLTDFVRTLDEHNLEVRSRRAARDALLSQFADLEPAVAWSSLAAVAQGVFPAYRAMRASLSLDRIGDSLAARLPDGTARNALLDGVDATSLPWVPRALDLGTGEWCWGTAPTHRIAAVLVTWINTLAAHAPAESAAELYALKAEVAAVRVEADRLSPPNRVFEDALTAALASPDTTPAEAFERARRQWPSADAATSAAHLTALNVQLARLGACLAALVPHARTYLAAQSAAGAPPPASLRGLFRLYDGAAAVGDATRLLLCLDVIEATFSGLEPRPDQEIRLVQFTSKGAIVIDELQRATPMDKLAGVELAHFGAFLKRSWRANDWMWGRLDAAQRLVALLDSLMGGPLSTAGTLEAHVRAIQAQILREELPSIVSEVEQDGRAGARVSEEGKAFCAAARELAGAPNGDIDLSGASDDDVARLFTLQLVGSENLGEEIGSDLATVTSIAALATAAGVLRAQGPKLLRGPVRVLGTSSSFAWRVAQRPSARRLRTGEAVLAVVLAVLGIVTIVVDAIVGLGPLVYAGWAALVLAIVLAVFVVPWVLLGFGRRAMGRERPH
jgi:predicted acylesterase/phospholipase RssA